MSNGFVFMFEEESGLEGLHNCLGFRPYLPCPVNRMSSPSSLVEADEALSLVKVSLDSF